MRVEPCCSHYPRRQKECTLRATSEAASAARDADHCCEPGSCEPVDSLAAGFHEAIASGSIHLIEKMGEDRVVLSGGVFCNRYLTETMLMRLEAAGRRGFIHSQLPPTDGSLAAGQMWVAAHTFDSN